MVNMSGVSSMNNLSGVASIANLSGAASIVNMSGTASMVNMLGDEEILSGGEIRWWLLSLMLIVAIQLKILQDRCLMLKCWRSKGKKNPFDEKRELVSIWRREEKKKTD